MTKEKAFEVVKQCIMEADPTISESDIISTAELSNDLGFDSLDVVELSMKIEDKLNVNSQEDTFLKAFEQVELSKATVLDIVKILEEI